MWTFKKPAAKAAELTEEALVRQAVGKIFVIVTVGILVLLFDLFVGFGGGTVPFLQEKDGVYLVRPAEGGSPGHIFLVANVQTDSGTVKKEYELSLYPCERSASGASGASGAAAKGSRGNSASGTMSEDELLAYELRSVLNSLNDDLSVRRVSLPGRLRTGEKITWGAEKKTNTALIVLAMILLALYVYKSRLDPLQRIRRAQMASVNRQLPEFASRLVLLLGAGLVLSTAFEHIVEERRQTQTAEDDYFYRCMDEIYNKIRETNSSLEKEFRSFARTSECSGKGSRELMRISNIISDNISKGAELTDKLMSESEALWLSRKSDSEERGRLAETKLTLPLTVFLLVLVVVTVSPALLEL